MANQLEPCFDKTIFHRFLDEQSEGHEEEQVLEHIGSCEKCRAALAELAGQDEEWSNIQQQLAEKSYSDVGAETQDVIRGQQRDLRAVQSILAPTDDPQMLGRLGGYEVCGVIGRGSAGIVVKALDTRLNRFVAIKMLAPVYSNNGSSRRRFEREGRAIASVKDPHVIPIHTVEEFQGTPYIVMEYVPDGSLFQRIEKQGPLSTREVVCLGMQIAKGLSAAHAAGIVHRDVKPGNVLLESGVERAMVTDFGLARVVDEATMTRSGSISGTPQYMSPEQARGEMVDPRSDLFSLGSVMYAACTGHSPFRAESVFGVIKRVCENEPRPIRSMNPDIAEWLTAFISKLHRKNPSDRFQSADEVAELLQKELAHMQSPTLVAEPNRDWWKKSEPVLVESKLAVAPKQTSSGWKFLAIAACVMALAGWGAFMIPGLGMGGGEGGKVGDGPASAMASSNSSLALLEWVKQENEKLPRFENQVETTIDVKDGGQLFFRTNLGTVNITTHTKPTVEMKLLYTVAAKDKETAAKLFKAVEMDYAVDAEVAADAELVKGNDAAIIAKFPTRKLTQEEIDAATDLDELKEQLLIRNNSHFRNAIFTLVIPETFNVDLNTSAGPIECTDIDGWAKMVTHGGHVDLGVVTGKANVLTHGGHVVVSDVGSNANIETHGGHIEIRDVNGQLVAHTHGGHIKIGDVAGDTDVATQGGRIEMGHANGKVKAKTSGGGITIWKASESVDANAMAGKIYVNFVEQPTKESILISQAGAVRVGIVEDLSFNIDAGSNAGSVKSPFSKKHSHSIKHRLNDGKVDLRVNATTGAVNIVFVEEEEIDEELEQLEEEREEEREQTEGRRAFDKAYDLHMAGKIDEAIKAHKAAARYDDFTAIATYNLGCAWALKGEKVKALNALEEAYDEGFRDLQQYESDSDLDSLRDEKRFKKIMKMLKQSDGDQASFRFDALPRSDVDRLVSQGMAMYRSDRFADAEKTFEQVLELSPQHEKVFAEMGAAIHAQGRLAEAYKWHVRAAKVEDCSIAKLGLYNMACVHSMKDELEESEALLTKAIKRGFVDVEHMKNDEDLKNLRASKRFASLVKLAKSKVKKSDCSDASECSDCKDECDSSKDKKAKGRRSPGETSSSSSSSDWDQF